MKTIIFSFVWICVCVGIQEVQAVVAKHNITTPPTEQAEYNAHDEDKDHADEDDSEQDPDDVAAYITPQCVKTIQKHKGEIENLKNKENSQEEANKLTQILEDGGCKPMMDYLAKKNRNKG